VADRPAAGGSDAPRAYDVSTYGERVADVYDDLARLAGLRLRERWGGWSREAFGASSGAHVSVYERAGEERNP
jgi:hypothetical protein